MGFYEDGRYYGGKFAQVHNKDIEISERKK